MRFKGNNSISPVLPDNASNLSKKEQVAEMFNNIAGHYDFLNHFLSLGIDKGWRKKAIQTASEVKHDYILDVATGTGDLAIAAMKLQPKKIIGIDIAEKMLDIGNTKIKNLGFDSLIKLLKADCESLPFEDSNFDVILCAYGVRNFENLEKGLVEMQRVLKPGGRVIILEFSHPESFPIKQLYRFYFKYFLPALGKIVSKHSRAYSYLPESVMAFPQGAKFTNILKGCGFRDTLATPLTFGITTLYSASK